MDDKKWLTEQFKANRVHLRGVALARSVSNRGRRDRGQVLMTTFVLIPGAGGAAWYWHRVLPLLEQAGYEALAVDLPGDDPHAGLHAYADLVIAAIGKRNDVALVAQSMGRFTAALACARAQVPIRMLAFVNAMIPLPGETASEWWDHTGWLQARKACAGRPARSRWCKSTAMKE